MPPRPERAPKPGFLVAGFECASNLSWKGGRLDPLAVTRHDAMAAEDYRLLRRAKVRTVREGLRWATIEKSPGRYDWSSAAPMWDAASEEGVAVIWDICHWGYPEDIDFFSDAFVHRMADFGAAAVEEMRRRGAPPAGIVPVNEVNFWSWAGGFRGFFPPFVKERGDEVKRQLVRAFVTVSDRLRPLVGGAPMIAGEPLVVVHPPKGGGHDPAHLAMEQEGMHGAWEALLGNLWPELGGHRDVFDWVGVNYYPHNQWELGATEMMPLDDPRRVRLSKLLIELQARYRKPILITETGDEQPGCAPWMRMVGGEALEAMSRGADIRGICLYPAMDYPGWDDNRQCPCGLFETDAEYGERRVRPDVEAALLAIADAVEQRESAANDDQERYEGSSRSSIRRRAGHSITP